MLVAVVLPCVDFAGEDLLVGDAAIQKLPLFSMTGAARASSRRRRAPRCSIFWFAAAALGHTQAI
jgi:hypothetical protein